MNIRSMAMEYGPDETPAGWVEQYRFAIEDYRAANSGDEQVLEALDRLERGESTVELVGFSRLEVVA